MFLEPSDAEKRGLAPPDPFPPKSTAKIPIENDGAEPEVPT